MGASRHAHEGFFVSQQVLRLLLLGGTWICGLHGWFRVSSLPGFGVT
jgi:hypothetical protein